MRIIGLSMSEIQQTNGVYNVGNQVELQALNKADCNLLLKTILNSKCVADKYMTRYYPYHTVIFDDDIYNSVALPENLSFTVDVESQAVLVGHKGKYKQNNGYLVFSGILSENGLLEDDIKLRMYKYNRANLILDKVLLLAIGKLPDGNMYGLWYVPSERGIGIENNGVTISTVTEENIDATTWSEFTIEDWIRGVKIKEVSGEIA